MDSEIQIRLVGELVKLREFGILRLDELDRSGQPVMLSSLLDAAVQQLLDGRSGLTRAQSVATLLRNKIALLNDPEHREWLPVSLGVKEGLPTANPEELNKLASDLAKHSSPNDFKRTGGKLQRAFQLLAARIIADCLQDDVDDSSQLRVRQPQGDDLEQSSTVSSTSILQKPDRTLVDLLRAQAAVARNLPYWPFGTDLPSLQDVYVELSLVPTSEQLRPSSLFSDERAVEYSLDEALTRYRNLLIVGEPGAGKSTLASQAVARLTATILDAGTVVNQWIPLFAPARFMVGPHGLDGLVAAALNQHLSGHLTNTLRNTHLFSSAWGDSKGWLIFVDAVDELIDINDRRRLVAQLSHHFANPALRFVILTRRLQETSLSSALEGSTGQYELASFNDAQLEEFALAWFRASSIVGQPQAVARAFLRDARDLGITDTIRIPLLATVASITYADNEFRFPDTIPQLYEEFVIYFLYRRQAQSRSRERIHALLTVAGVEGDSLAEQLYMRRRDLCAHIAHRQIEGDNESVVTIATNWIRETIADPPIVPEWNRHLESVLIDTGVMVRQGLELRFIHYSVAEYLAAPLAGLPGPVDRCGAWSLFQIRWDGPQYVMFRVLAWARTNDPAPLVRQLLADDFPTSYLTLILLARYGLPLNEDAAQGLLKFFITGADRWKRTILGLGGFDLDLEITRLLCSVAPLHPAFIDRLVELTAQDLTRRMRRLVLNGLWDCGHRDLVNERLRALADNDDPLERLAAAQAYIDIDSLNEAFELIEPFLHLAEAPEVWEARSILAKLHGDSRLLAFLDNLRENEDYLHTKLWFSLALGYYNMQEFEASRHIVQKVIDASISEEDVNSASGFLARTLELRSNYR